MQGIILGQIKFDHDKHLFELSQFYSGCSKSLSNIYV